MNFLNLNPLNHQQKPYFWPILWLKMDLSAEVGVLSPATGLDAGDYICFVGEREKPRGETVYRRETPSQCGRVDDSPGLRASINMVVCD